MEAIDLDTSPRKKLRATATALRYSVDTMCGFTINPYAKGLKNKINIVFHKGVCPPIMPSPMQACYLGG